MATPNPNEAPCYNDCPVQDPTANLNLCHQLQKLNSFVEANPGQPVPVELTENYQSIRDRCPCIGAVAGEFWEMSSRIQQDSCPSFIGDCTYSASQGPGTCKVYENVMSQKRTGQTEAGIAKKLSPGSLAHLAIKYLLKMHETECPNVGQIAPEILALVKDIIFSDEVPSCIFQEIAPICIELASAYNPEEMTNFIEKLEQRMEQVGFAESLGD